MRSAIVRPVTTSFSRRRRKTNDPRVIVSDWTGLDVALSLNAKPCHPPMFIYALKHYWPVLPQPDCHTVVMRPSCRLFVCPVRIPSSKTTIRLRNDRRGVIVL